MKLARYIARRALLLIPTLLVVSTITFIVSRLLPGNPAIYMAGPAKSPEVIQTLTEAMGLDKPLYMQYIIYHQDLLQGDFGFAWHTGKSVAYDLAIRFAATFELTIISLIFAILLGIPLGMLAALKANKKTDHIVRVGSLVGLSVPEYVIGLLFIYLFYYQIPIFPPILGRIDIFLSPPTDLTGLYIVDSLITMNWEVLRSSLASIFLPAFTLALVMMAPITRFTRSAMLDVLYSEHILAAKSYGLSKFTINFKHALKIASFRVTTIIGVIFGYLLSGAILVENVFSWPGLGRYAVESLRFSDFAAVQGVVLVMTCSYIVINLLVDITLASLDPRVKY